MAFPTKVPRHMCARCVHVLCTSGTDVPGWQRVLCYFTVVCARTPYNYGCVLKIAFWLLDFIALIRPPLAPRLCSPIPPGGRCGTARTPETPFCASRSTSPRHPLPPVLTCALCLSRVPLARVCLCTHTHTRRLSRP